MISIVTVQAELDNTLFLLDEYIKEVKRQGGALQQLTQIQANLQRMSELLDSLVLEEEIAKEE